VFGKLIFEKGKARKFKLANSENLDIGGGGGFPERVISWKGKQRRAGKGRSASKETCSGDSEIKNNHPE